MKFVPDVNALVANILSETIDIILPDTVDVETALEIRKRWEGTGNQVRLDTANQFQQIELQHRPEYSKPRNGFTIKDWIGLRAVSRDAPAERVAMKRSAGASRLTEDEALRWRVAADRGSFRRTAPPAARCSHSSR